MQHCVLVAKGLAAHERPPQQEEGYDVCAELSEGAVISGASPDQRDRSASAAISNSGSFREKPNELETAEEKLSRSGEEKGHQRSRSLGESKKVKCKCMLFLVVVVVVVVVAPPHESSFTTLTFSLSSSLAGSITMWLGWLLNKLFFSDFPFGLK